MQPFFGFVEFGEKRLLVGREIVSQQADDGCLKVVGGGLMLFEVV